MVYELVRGFSPNLLIPWIYIFRCLSIPQFSKVYDKLDFPAEPNTELQQLARDFSLSYDINLGNSVSEIPSINLFEGTFIGDPHRKRIGALFANTFEHLSKLGYGQVIYSWGKQTSDFRNPEEVRQLRAWCKLLVRWAISEQIKDPILLPEDWNIVITKWRGRYDMPNQLAVEHIPLSTSTNHVLRTIIVQCEANRLDLQSTLEQFLNADQNAWEEFVLRPGGGYMWMSGEGNFQTYLKERDMIIGTLELSEMLDLENWAKTHKIRTPLRNMSS